MTITTCPHCQMRILPRLDGTCPSCNNPISQADTSPQVKPSGAAVKRPAKPDRRKPGAKSARSSSSAPPVSRNLELTYSEYLETAKVLWKGSLRIALSYLLAGIILGVLCILVSFLTWDQKLVDNGFVSQPGPTTWVFIWIGVAAILGSVLLGAVKGNQWAKVQIRDIVWERPGFPEFYGAYLRRTWPKTGMPAGPALKKFSALLEKK